jgi:MtrB/PioB family decaheme-associated outer membrane protein
VALLPTGAARAESSDEIEGEFTFGPQYLMEDQTQDSAKFLEYREVSNGFWAESFRFTWRPSSGSYFDLDVRDLVQTDQIIHARFGRTDLWKISIDWVENPRLWTDRAETLFAGQGDGIFTLEDSFQSAVQAGAANPSQPPYITAWPAGTKGAIVKNAIDTGAQSVFVGHQRETGTVGFELMPTRSWTVGASVARERRSGTTPQSLGFYFTWSPAEVAAPVDFRTDWASVRAEYNREKFNVGGEVIASKFETGYDSLTWDNQLYLADTPLVTTVAGSGLISSTSNPGHGRLTLGTNNEMTQAILYGGINLPARTRVDVTVSRGEVTQDDPFLPMTVNGSISPAIAPLPAASLDGKHTNTFANLRIASRPAKSWRWSAWYRDQELENGNPRLQFADYVQTDGSIPYCSNANSCGALANRIQRENLPLSYARSNMGALLGWSPVRWFDGSLSYEIETIDREHAAVEESDEDIVTLRLDFPVADWLMLRTTARYQERRADDYHVHYYEESFPIGEPYVAAFNEGSRRHTWTDRDRVSYAVMFEVTPASSWSIYGEASYSDDDYLDPVTGQAIGTSFGVMEDRNFDLTDEAYTLLLAGRTVDKLYSHTLGVAFSPSSRFNLYADYTWETGEYAMATRYRAPIGTAPFQYGSDNPLDDWTSAAEDRYYTYSFGFDAALNAKRTWRINGDVSRSEGKGDLETNFVPGGNAASDTALTAFPQVDTRLAIAHLALTHAIRPNLDYAVRWWYERWQEANWASDQMQPYMGDPDNDPGSATAMYLGMDFLNYSNHILSLMLRYTF